MDERLTKQLRFACEIDKEKNIFRQTHLTGHGRRENDAEHAWHMAVMAYLLKEYSNEPIDIAKVMIMCLIHDIVEIDAGDTYAYDEEAKKTQKEREEKAKERIFSILPEEQKAELIAIFDEFEESKKKIAIYYTGIAIYIKLNHFATYLKLTKHCKSTILQKVVWGVSVVAQY